ncbi:Cof-type HAD-IIB family hydrolase [Halobacillus mangrovi]|uniref:Phosphatase n=1 Tax=Halobacillus mangrovi TaxID=402384 RepID=A0A1W5ZXI5_9BACI|nr:Cof-type HAD-IIB family hydrolase [Halobacillus mangrovi]ARI78045.1 phosphatase [Halobacillus mangrovi]
MNKQHLIALDLDGTLLTDDKVISTETKETVLKAMDQGHIVVIATGRPHRASIDFYHELGLETPMVNFNGALIHHPKDHHWDAIHSPLSIRTAHKIIHTCQELGVKNILAEVKDKVYLDQHDEEIMSIFQTKNDPITVGRLQSNLKEDPTSILIHPEEEKIKKLRQELDTHASLIDHRKWGAPWHVIEIVRSGMNKAVGLDKIARYFHIPQNRIIAFGDEDNDFEMIDYAGVGVAMGNAINELKGIANHVTLTNEEDGIGEFLTEYLKLNKKAM